MLLWIRKMRKRRRTRRTQLQHPLKKRLLYVWKLFSCINSSRDHITAVCEIAYTKALWLLVSSVATLSNNFWESSYLYVLTNPLARLYSDLMGRYQNVSHYGRLSSYWIVKYVIPQGSILGLILRVLYAAGVVLIIAQPTLSSLWLAKYVPTIFIERQ